MENSETEGLDAYWLTLARNANVKKQKNIEKICTFIEMNKFPLGEYCIWMCSKHTSGSFNNIGFDIFLQL